MKDKIDDIQRITEELINSIGEDPNREGLLKTPLRVAKSWDYFTQGYSAVSYTHLTLPTILLV